MRVRSRTNLENTWFRETWTQPWHQPPSNPAISLAYQSSTYPSYLDQETTTDEVHPQAISRINRGEIVAGPFTKTRSVYSSGDMELWIYQNCVYDYSRWVVWKHFAAPQSWMEWQIPNWASFETDKASVLVAARAKAATPALQTLVTLGELKSTMQMCNRIAGQLLTLATSKRRLLDYLRSNRRNALSNREAAFNGLGRYFTKKKVGSYWKTLSNEWLQYRYGLRQLAFDQQGFIDAVNQKASQRLRYTATGQIPFTNGFYQSIVDNDGGIVGLRNTRYLYCTQQGSISAGVLVKEEPTTTSAFLHDWGLTSILPTVWDLTKFSFVVDMVLNVGEILKSYELEYHRTVLLSWITSRLERNRTHYRVFTKHPDWYDMPVNAGGASTWLRDFTVGEDNRLEQTLRETEVEREIDPEPLHLLDFKPKLNATKLLDLLGLLAQFRREL